MSSLEFEKARQDVKDGAIKGEQVNAELLHEKITRLESVARKNHHVSKEKINLLLSRFHLYKAKPSFAAVLVLKSLCNKEEEAMLDQGWTQKGLFTEGHLKPKASIERHKPRAWGEYERG